MSPQAHVSLFVRPHSFDICHSDPVLCENGSVVTKCVGKDGNREVGLWDHLPVRSWSPQPTANLHATDRSAVKNGDIRNVPLLNKKNVFSDCLKGRYDKSWSANGSNLKYTLCIQSSIPNDNIRQFATHSYKIYPPSGQPPFFCAGSPTEFQLTIFLCFFYNHIWLENLALF